MTLHYHFNCATIIADSAIEPYEICLPYIYILYSFALFVYPFLLLIRISSASARQTHLLLLQALHFDFFQANPKQPPVIRIEHFLGLPNIRIYFNPSCLMCNFKLKRCVPKKGDMMDNFSIDISHDSYMFSPFLTTHKYSVHFKIFRF